MRVMRRLSIAVFLGMCFVHGTPAVAESEPDPVTVSWETAVASKYLFQGIDYSSGNPVAQPELSLEYRKFSLTSWFNFDLDGRHVNEIDLLFAYEWELGPLSVTPGYARYRYPHKGWDPSQELYLDLSYETFLDLALSTHYDFDAGKGAYFTLGLHREVETSVGTFGVGSNLFYQWNYYETSGIPSLEFTANYGGSIRSVSITPAVSYFATWDNGDFKEQSAVPRKWLVSLTVGQSY
jgi:hypothetical protein